MLNILTLIAVKASMLTALHTLTPMLRQRYVIYATGVVMMAWGVTSIFAVAFQCPSPQRWNVVNETCINIVSLKF